MAQEEQHPPSPPQSILVVDDEQQVCEILAEALSARGHLVGMATDGADALEKMKDTRYSIIITDMDMPRMDGMQLIQSVAHSNHGIDVIAITGHTMRYTYTDVVEAGAADFLTKPFTLNELEAKINRVVRERDLRDKLERLATRDPLTGLSNRRYFLETVRKEAIRAVRYRHPLFMFFIDIDHFKSYNDQFGHQAGDDLLEKLAFVLQASIRLDVDSAFRYGGDEFVLLLPHLPGVQAVVVAERIRENFNRLDLKPTSLSIGIAKYLDRCEAIEEDVDDMILRSDRALYYAKHNGGRDKVFVDAESE
jgi:two-component system cell cycle response regulator